MSDLVYKDVLIYDIESSTPNGLSDVGSHKLKVFGCYSYKYNRYFFLTDLDKIIKMISEHKFFVGFNNLQYDNFVLYNSGFSDMIEKNHWGDYKISNYKINIDLMQIFKNRAGSMKVGKDMLGDILMHYSLDFISKTIGIVDKNSSKIDDFDYSLLNKESWSKDETRKIIEYTKRDLEITKKMYEWLEDYFKDFKFYLNEHDIATKKYLTASTASFAYKAICHQMGWEEEYGSSSEKQKFEGAYVSYPIGEHFSGDIYCLDFSSLYPSIMHQCNIYSPDNDGWSGGDKFRTLGTYNDKKLGKVEQLLRKWYEQRVVFKAMKDSREYSIKIIINTIYGILGNSSFSKLYNHTGGSDVTRLGRQWILLARKRFREAGYVNIYSDTDSCYLLDPFNNKEKLLEVKNKIIEEIQSSVPFPYTKHSIGVVNGKELFAGFDMGVDAEISHIWFFNGGNIKENDLELDEDDLKAKELNLMKKNYIYLTKDGRVVVKNLGVRKKSSSALSRKIFWDYLASSDGWIVKEKKVKFSKKRFEDLIFSLLKDDLELAGIRYKVNRADSYKIPSQLQAQIASKYGEGIHILIPNFRLGVGKGKKYCSLEEFSGAGLGINDINLSNIWSELKYFISDDSGGTNENSSLLDFF